MSCCAEYPQHDADDEQDDPYGAQDGDAENQAEDEQDYAEKHHAGSVPSIVIGTPLVLPHTP
jgi:hypothetical protein